ncbi:hypothetical protein CLG96_03060 [Sphingomonas oleivorans]|uniref:EAL domain-containing protein n=1 Tax=Sphingomonas oleivorans TaxID=1735121 RepID=A0A2T5G1U7_9SPHN|nr:hypothetical protein CLG96_03060 [Sphingomonas oleivorans]
MNVSPVQFRLPNLVEQVAAILARTGLDGRRLELEITETVLMRDRETVLATLHRLKALGTRIAMDDFGTGYSSLSNLKSFPFDKIKIDRSFRAFCAANPISSRARGSGHIANGHEQGRQGRAGLPRRHLIDIAPATRAVRD